MATSVIDPTVNSIYKLLKVTYGLLPILAGADKFRHLLVDWHKYLYPGVPEILSISSHTFMHIVGIVEIVAGLLVFLFPNIGAYLVSAWLFVIVMNLIMGGFYDIALRDFTLGIGALALGRLKEVKERAII
ncbi:hypothetical protein C900_04759 [Fulvivirga imtechensis AK7]|uniref:Transmembrane protein n=2 Tax=Fulvivirga TaxID=396811 RepID=L8JYM3_9BACT|nr:hypothetical protein C900_04759 [Fulvivirga imtechensis AK7]